MVSDIRPEQLYLLFVNQQQVPDIFPTLEMAKEAAMPHIPSQAALQIKSTWNRVRSWNYRYDLKQWLEMT
ncbi:MAG: hypothetical protein AABY96_13980 [Nitrospirota bacterium]